MIKLFAPTPTRTYLLVKIIILYYGIYVKFLFINHMPKLCGGKYSISIFINFIFVAFILSFS